MYKSFYANDTVFSILTCLNHYNWQDYNMYANVLCLINYPCYSLYIYCIKEVKNRPVKRGLESHAESQVTKRKRAAFGDLTNVGVNNNNTYKIFHEILRKI